MIAHIPIDGLTFGDIEALVTESVAEGRQLDYKQALPGNGDKDKMAFLRDVTAFANTVGGDIVYGVAEGEESGIPSRICGVSGIDFDKEARRLESMVRDNIEPRIQGLQCRMVGSGGHGSVVVVRVPRSFSAPHMVTFGDRANNRFYARTNGCAQRL